MGLFAAGDRKAPASLTTPASTALDAPITTTPESILEEASIHITASASRSTAIEMQAELLRLEAEKEQLEIDQQRIESEQRRLEEIDRLILKIVEGGDLEKLMTSNRVLVRKELFFRLAELANAAIHPEEKSRLVYQLINFTISLWTTYLRSIRDLFDFHFALLNRVTFFLHPYTEYGRYYTHCATSPYDCIFILPSVLGMRHCVTR